MRRRPTLLSIACAIGLACLAVRAWRERVAVAIPPTPVPVPTVLPPAAPPPAAVSNTVAGTNLPDATPSPAAPGDGLPQPAPATPPQPAPPETTEPPPPETDKPVLLDSAQLERLVAGPGVADMRMLTLTLRVDPAAPAVNGEDIRVRTRFYHQDALSRQIASSDAAESEVTLSGRLEPGGTVTITRPYVLAAPLPSDPAAAEGGSPRTFHGFRVEVYHRDRLVEKIARPASLPDS